MNRKRGFTLIELLVVIAIIALLIGLLLPALAKAQKNAKSARDLAQTKQIHQAMLVFAESAKGWLPIPGKVNRLADPHTGLQLPGRGPEDSTRNWSAPLYSLLIAQDFFNPDLCIGTTETLEYVIEKDDFNFASYRPDQDIYWDDTFQSNLDGGISNTSYAHLSICGKRKETEYKNTNSTETAIIVTRGTRDGATDGADYARAPSLTLHGPEREWHGNICFNDNSAQVITNFFPPTINYEAQDGINPIEKDNIFQAEFTDFGIGEASGDCWMTVSTGADASGEEIDEVWDPNLF